MSSKMIEAYYKTPTDIAFFFRDKDSITELIEFILKECEAFADAIDSHGNQIPYPIIYSNKGFTFQIDYQFYIHCLAKFISLKTNVQSNYTSVINAFAVLPSNVKKGSIAHKNRKYLIFLHEFLNGIFDSNNGYNNYNALASFTPVLYKYEDIFVEYKVISIKYSDTNEIQKGYGFEPYIGKNWREFRERYRENFIKYKMEQVAFKSKEIKKFLSENELKKFNFFMINGVEIAKYNEYINYDLASQIYNCSVDFKDAK